MLCTVESVLTGNIEAIDQCIAFIERLSPEQYCHVSSPVTSSSIGAHFRHILDIYLAVMSAEQNAENCIDYDVRRRGHVCERDPIAALHQFAELRAWLLALPESQWLRTLSVKTEVTLSQTESVVVSATLLRELIFASSHTVHHLAIISIVAKLQHLDVDVCLGIAPATATFLRAQRSSSK